MSTGKLLGRDKTLPMEVKNTGFLLDRLGEDCHPLQFLRELTQNSIEAIGRSGKPGKIVWDAEWNYLERNGVYKLCVTDNGIGMNEADLHDYINKLSSSSSEQSLSGNYGVGAKIAAATRNHAGVVYLSWKDSAGHCAHFWRAPDTGRYGLKPLESSDGELKHVIALSDEAKPELIGTQGTMVVLLGNADSDDTMRAPEIAPAKSRWIAKYLNSRYFRFPQFVTVQAREGWEADRSDQSRNKLRTITGQHEYLKKHSIEKGKVELESASLHWWILEDSKALDQESNYYASIGHVAALHHEELYEMSTGRGSIARLQDFGVLFGARRVVIYVEPKQMDNTKITTNTARTQLLINNEPLPWSEWAAEFRENMPKEIDEFIQSNAPTANSADHGKTIKDRLKPILALYKLTRYRPTPDGELRIDPDAKAGGEKPAGGNGRNSASGVAANKSGKSAGRAGSFYSLFEKIDGVPGKQANADPFPDWVWVSIKDNSREPGDMEDRAAKFLKEQNKLLINADFRVFIDMIKAQHKEYGGASAIRPVVEETVKAWFEQALIETVIGVQALRNSNEWTVVDIDKALSEEGLTVAVMQRYHINERVRREIGSKLRLKPSGQKEEGEAG